MTQTYISDESDYRVVTGSQGRVFLIRAGQEVDSRALYDYKSKVFRETEWLLQAWEDFESDPERESLFLRRFSNSPNSLMLLAFSEGEVIGTLSLFGGPYRRTSHVAALGMGVLRSWWGHGVGSAMMEEALQWARTNPLVEKLNLQVYHTNERALALYRKFGFVQEGCLRKDVRLDDGTDVDLILMGKQLGE